MSDEKPQPVYRTDYRPPDYRIDEVDLHFELGEEDTIVSARLSVRIDDALAGDTPPLVLDGVGYPLNAPEWTPDAPGDERQDRNLCVLCARKRTSERYKARRKKA